MPKPKVLCICLGNSGRSIMAAALARHRCGDRWETASAGINPLGFVALETLAALARKQPEKPGREIIFDGAFHARLIALNTVMI
jgi:protein-tyrosine-phosphatase